MARICLRPLKVREHLAHIRKKPRQRLPKMWRRFSTAMPNT